ncbi:MAG: hypothetical protein P0Y64_05645 [Candidatus Sphingomonas colombiensis]|nr:hypothetical protein [Sphingomonas sp.]WEK44292.1 MAG: hypothetical protein P0Y64_05645 [Sphingomonas sp.]
MIEADLTRWPPDEGVTDPVEQRAIWRQFVPSGWHSIYDDLMVKIEAVAPGFFLSEAKERFGGLRVGVRGRLGEAPAIVGLRLGAEQQSYRTCSICAAPGRLCVDARGWFLTVCSHHDEGLKPYVADRPDERGGPAGHGE